VVPENFLGRSAAPEVVLQLQRSSCSSRGRFAAPEVVLDKLALNLGHPRIFKPLKKHPEVPIVLTHFEVALRLLEAPGNVLSLWVRPEQVEIVQDKLALNLSHPQI